MTVKAMHAADAVACTKLLQALWKVKPSKRDRVLPDADYAAWLGRWAGHWARKALEAP